MTIIEKGHESALRIFNILKILLKEESDISNIIEQLKSYDNLSCALSHEAYLKYFNTFRLIGLDVEKNDEKYCLKNALFSIDLTKNEEKILIKLIKTIPKLNDEENIQIIKNFILRLDKYIKLDLRKELAKLENNTLTTSEKVNIIKTFESAKENSQEVFITYKNKKNIKKTLECRIKKIGKTEFENYVVCIIPTLSKTKRIYLNSIINVRPQKNITPKNTVVFELYDRLSKSYRLKKGEVLEDFGTNFCRISNFEENQKSLLQRLLKYGENCKVLYPKSAVNNFLSLTKNVLANLEEH